MTPEKERQVLESLYDRLHDAISYSPEGKNAAFNPATSYIQMAKNVVLNPDDFKNMMTPLNPGGDLRQAEAFSALVDAQPNPEPLWSDSGKQLSATYSTIVNGANTDATVSEEQKKIYEMAFNYLNTTSTVTGFDGSTTTQTNPSQIATAYDNNLAAYVTAVGGYRTAYNGYDLSDVKDQRAWNAVQPGLQLTVDQAWNKWNNEGRKQVDEAQAAMASSINNAIASTIANSQALVNGQHQMAPSTAGGNPWLPSYALPSNWMDPSIKATELTLKSSYLNKTASSSATSYAASASGSWGLWHASAGVSGSHEENHAHMDAENLELSAELVFVQIKRPWFNPLLFSMNDWWVDGFNKNGISDGLNPPSGALPLIPTGMIVARNVSITADFSSEDKSFVANSIKTEASGGWGPFSVSGSYSHSDSKSTFASKFDGGTLKLPGLQVIGWVSAINHASAPMDPK
ncbi:hypothetical protein [Shimia ponticola]|uniref:hypothetical protein n=1 Tax=Shimia ponticola TaxID=2582893 RepID=UPI0011BDB94A|nr:hypothetical protein [Shimia ponticola]